MKRIILVIMAALMLHACGSKEGKNTPEAAPAVSDPSSNPDYDKGLTLVSKLDCLTCHKVDEKVTGPAYGDISKKYANDPKAVEYLSEKVIKGGSGNWGNIPMAAHPQVSKADAELMVKYILLLNK
jgi:cytochrome c